MKKESLIFCKRKSRELQNKKSLQWLLYSHWIPFGHFAHFCSLFFKLSWASPSSRQEGFLTSLQSDCLSVCVLDSLTFFFIKIPNCLATFSVLYGAAPPPQVCSPHLCCLDVGIYENCFWDGPATISRGKNSVSGGI